MKIKQTKTLSIHGSFDLYLKKATYTIEWKIHLSKKPQLTFNIINIILKNKKTSNLDKMKINMDFLKRNIQEYWIDYIFNLDHVKKLMINRKKTTVIMWAKK